MKKIPGTYRMTVWLNCLGWEPKAGCIVRLMMKIVVQFVLLAAAYLAFAGQLSADECIAAVVTAAMITVLSLIAHRSHKLQFNFSLLVVTRQVTGVLPKLVTDTLTLIPRLLRSGWQTGMMSQEFVANASIPDDAAWWAMFTLTTSLPPNSYVISRLTRPGEVIMHRLAEPHR